MHMQAHGYSASTACSGMLGAYVRDTSRSPGMSRDVVWWHALIPLNTEEVSCAVTLFRVLGIPCNNNKLGLFILNIRGVT